MKPISPWAGSAELISPDGRFRAIIRNAGEIAMGAPTSGNLVVERASDSSPIATLHDCNPSIVWSDDSKAVAVPQWTARRKQYLILISIPDGRAKRLPDEYHVLELHSFSHGVIRGVDSPIHMPKQIALRVFEE